MGLWLRLIGTVTSTFRIGFNRAVLDSAALTSQRVYDLPDKAGTFALLDDVSGVGIVLDASEALEAGNLINIWDDSGTTKARLADAGANKQADGYVLAAVDSGDPATVYSQGINDQLSGMTGGVEYYLSASVPGGVTDTAPTGSGNLVQRVGKAFSATELDFKKGTVFKRG
jgi:hypothetical protein